MRIIEGRVEAVFITPEAALVAERRQEIESTLWGIWGDRHQGFTTLTKGKRERSALGVELPYEGQKLQVPNWRQWSAVSTTELKRIATNLGLAGIDLTELASLLGANMLVSDDDKFSPRFSDVPAGSMFVFPSGCIWEVRAENFPCDHPGKNIHNKYQQVPEAAFVKAALHNRGLMGNVFYPGVIKVGDNFKLQIRE
ncbi:MAG: hypothetical protein HY817_05290 [Candidatus Abawacabacteria bacterium]|nr:hypothetical protein [Candidatus Abawacabacteria bacterium]